MHFLVVPDKLDNKRHKHDILYLAYEYVTNMFCHDQMDRLS